MNPPVQSTAPHTADTFDVERIRAAFPILSIQVGKKPLIYLDNAASAQKPQAVIDAISRYYSAENANIHRGVHYLSTTATEAYEEARRKVAAFINAPTDREVVFVRGATEGINLVAHGLTRTKLKAGDRILITAMEHHANIVPWQLAAEQTSAELDVVPVTDDGMVDLDAFREALGRGPAIAAFVHVSNTLGTINPVKAMVAEAKAAGVTTLVDGCQAIPHMRVDVQDIDADFYVFSGHKLFGPTGIGILHGKFDALNALPPYQGGGDMIDTVTFEKTTFREPPERFEAGTPHIAGVIGLAAAIDYVNRIGMENIEAYEAILRDYALDRLQAVEGLTLYGQAEERAAVFSFLLGDIHPHDLGTFLDTDGIAIRTGHHCTQPLLKRFGVPATARASFAFYNTHAEVDALVSSLKKIRDFFG